MALYEISDQDAGAIVALLVASERGGLAVIFNDPALVTVGVYVEGGMIQSARASHANVSLEIDDDDLFSTIDPALSEKEADEYKMRAEARKIVEALPHGIY